MCDVAEVLARQFLGRVLQHHRERMVDPQEPSVGGTVSLGHGALFEADPELFLRLESLLLGRDVTGAAHDAPGISNLDGVGVGLSPELVTILGSETRPEVPHLVFEAKLVEEALPLLVVHPKANVLGRCAEDLLARVTRQTLEPAIDIEVVPGCALGDIDRFASVVESARELLFVGPQCLLQRAQMAPLAVAGPCHQNLGRQGDRRAQERCAGAGPRQGHGKAGRPQREQSCNHGG